MEHNFSRAGRLLYLDVCKGIAICLVVLTHLNMQNPFYTWFSSFFLTLFLFVSAIIIDSGKKYNVPFKNYASKRIRSVMIPYYTFS